MTTDSVPFHKAMQSADVEAAVNEALSKLAARVAEAEKKLRDGRVACAFDLIARANTVTILSLGEMQSIVIRALNGEFDYLQQAPR